MNKLKQGLKPDRVYGLRQTRNLENFLYAPCDGEMIARDLLGSSPYSEDGEPLLFPFIVVEAKSGKSDDDWHSIKLQTSIPIFTFLNAQQKLKSAVGKKLKWRSGPWVWFFMNKGEDWRLFVAFQRRTNASDNYFETLSLITLVSSSLIQPLILNSTFFRFGGVVLNN
jgi:hypothetical protein